MTKTSRFLAGALVLPMLMAARPFVEAKPHLIDKAHSQINLMADSRLISAHGSFGKWDADITLDATNWSASTVAITIRGVTKRIVVPATAVFYEKGAGRFRGQFAINRKDYGVAFDSPVNPIENEVQVQWDMAISEPKPAAAK